MKTILLAGDKNLASTQAVAYVFGSLSEGESLNIVYIVPSDLMFYSHVDQLATQPDKEAFHDYIIQIGMEEADLALQSIRSHAQEQGVLVHTHVAWGNPAATIVEFAKKINADEVVLPSKAWGTAWSAPKYAKKITSRIACNVTIM